MAQIQAIKGFADMFAGQSGVFTFMEEAARRIFSRYGYGELRTPLMEYTDLFCRGIGTETDVVQKEMYTFQDSRERSMALRPEATAGVMRAFIESGMAGREGVNRFFTTGPMFRHERPQKGRLRQFHQLNCECLGPVEAEADAELICMLMDFLAALGLNNLTLQVNSLGCSSCRPAYRETLRAWLHSLDSTALCEDCRRRMETNPLRVLDCKVPSCQPHIEKAPTILEHNCPECKAHFSVVQSLLAMRNVSYVINHRLVRGLDYYNRTTFEVVAQGIGAQGSLAGGGRYDGLVAALGGPDVPGLGFACGMERLALALEAQNGNAPVAPPRPDFYLALLDEAGTAQGFDLTQTLRAAGFSGSMGFGKRSVKSLMRQADKSGARFALILGTDELAQGTVVVKNMESSQQSAISRTDVLTMLR